MIPYGKQTISDEDVLAVSAALKSDWLTIGPLVENFENEIEKIVGVPSISVTSGTAALHCAYAAIGIKPGDEVITPPITFVATQATAALMGAKIVFADIQPDTGNIDPNVVESLITSKTKAITAVDYAGHPAELKELREIADKFGVYLIEDASHSIGSLYRGIPVGSIADLTTFSFFPTKNLTTAEGGAVSSRNVDLLERAKRFARQGLVRDPLLQKYPNEGPWHQEVHEFGLNYRLPDVLCALGISQIARLKEFKKQRTRIFENYMDAFKNISGIELPGLRNYVDPMWHLFPIRVNPNNRKDIFKKMRNSGIGVQVNYIPAYWHPVFKEMGYERGLCPHSEKFYKSEISLPMFPGLSNSEQERTIEITSEILERYV
jgi:dTDP-4-amino-4,6-dideoxygalactose transaminase